MKDNYKYIIIDVRFEKGFYTDVDSALFALISEMPKLCISTHSDITIADSILMSKAAISDYFSTITATNFERYPLFYDKKPTVALRAYEEITGESINSFGPFYFQNDQLCNNSLFLKIPLRNFDEYREDGTKLYYNLGADILDVYDSEEISSLAHDKVVIIGDMIEDIHDTYAGLRPGPALIFYALTSLLEGNHIVSITLVLFLMIVYSIITYFIIKSISLFDRFEIVKKHNSVRFLSSFVGYMFLLTIISFFLYLLYDITISFLIPSLIFSIEKNIINYKNKTK